MRPRATGLDEESVRVHVTESVAIEDGANDQGVETVNTVSVVETESGNVTGNVIVREKEIAIGTGSAITANHIQGNVHAVEKENVSVKEIVNIESEAEKKVQHVNQPGQE